MQPVIEAMNQPMIQASYDEILKALKAGGFNCDVDEDAEPIVISEKNRIVYYSLDTRMRSIALYSIFPGIEGNRAEKEDLADELSDEFDLPIFAINRDNMHVRMFISCIAGLSLPELYRATQLFCRDINAIEDDPRVLELFPAELAAGREVRNGRSTN